MKTLSRRITAEFLGTLFLVAAVIGSGVMGERLAAGNVAVALLANTIATGAALVALILTFSSISGAHLNPAVTLADAIERGIAWREVPAYVAAQCTGGLAGAVVAHLMFGLKLYSFSSHVKEWTRSGLQRICCDLRAAICNLGMLAGPPDDCALCSRGLHHSGVLVHCIDIIRKSRSYNCTLILGYLCGDWTG